jgi:RHH-type transcriptional regulator, rel operon repressor / antitoxin RelB
VVELVETPVVTPARDFDTSTSSVGSKLNHRRGRSCRVPVVELVETHTVSPIPLVELVETHAPVVFLFTRKHPIGRAMTIAVRLTDDQQRRLDALAARTGRSRSFYVKEALETHLDELEERFWADDVIRDWEASDKRTRPLEELKAELGL